MGIYQGVCSKNIVLIGHEVEVAVGLQPAVEGWFDVAAVAATVDTAAAVAVVTVLEPVVVAAAAVFVSFWTSF